MLSISSILSDSDEIKATWGKT